MSVIDPKNVSWIGVDWGTSHLRVWSIGCNGEIITGRKSDRGMATLERGEFESSLYELISDLMPPDQNIPIIACGMVGSRQGWTDAGYVATPCIPPSITGSAVPADTKLQVHILSGVKQADPADVMRGEETQIAGYLHENPDFEGVVCLPGTHTKWVHVRAGEIVSFQTYMTGELFSMLSENSVLRHSMATHGWDGDAFALAISDAMACPSGFAAHLFRLRAGSLIDRMPPDVARSRLSGLLIGMELAAAHPYWFDQNVTIIGRKNLAQLYLIGLQAQGLSPKIASSKDMVLLGLTAAYETLREIIT